MIDSTEQPKWRKSSRCANGGCVEVAGANGGFLLRDSKNPDQPPLRFSAEELTAFAQAYLAGEFRSE